MTKKIDRDDRHLLHQKLGNLTYFERHNKLEFEIRIATLRRDMGFTVREMQKIYDAHKGMFGVQSWSPNLAIAFKSI